MTPQEHLDLAERFMDAIQAGDAEAVRACYAPDAAIWHNNDGIEQSVEQNLRVLRWFARTLPDRKYKVSRREALPDGFLQQHVLEATLPDGTAWAMDACVVVRIKDGLITRLDEYLDSAKAAALTPARAPDRLYGIMLQLIDAWQSRDIERVLSHLDDDIVWHYAAGAMPPARGKAHVAKVLGRLQPEMHDISWRIFAHAEAGERLFVEGVDEHRTAGGQRVAAPYAGVMEFKGDRIVGWRDYVDTGVMAQQREGQPPSAQVLALIERPPAA